MAADTAGEGEHSTDSALRQWGIVVSLLASLVGVPAAVLAEIEVGLITALGFSGDLAFGLVVMIPGLAMGALSLVVMLGS